MKKQNKNSRVSMKANNFKFLNFKKVEPEIENALTAQTEKNFRIAKNLVKYIQKMENMEEVELNKKIFIIEFGKYTVAIAADKAYSEEEINQFLREQCFLFKLLRYHLTIDESYDVPEDCIFCFPLPFSDFQAVAFLNGHDYSPFLEEELDIYKDDEWIDENLSEIEKLMNKANGNVLLNAITNPNANIFQISKDQILVLLTNNEINENDILDYVVENNFFEEHFQKEMETHGLEEILPGGALAVALPFREYIGAILFRLPEMNRLAMPIGIAI
ncbi:MAG TPA: hypothetical protein VNW06_02115 [Cytophagaceae bacterium]|jgi:hypothetical protein|nr:hypothetical protein [Cytophagaceae bacterium]